MVRDQTALDARHPRRPGHDRRWSIVTTPEEMPVTETIELAGRLRDETNVDLAAVVVNRVLPELFGRGEEEVFERAAGARRRPALLGRRPGRARARCSTPPSWPCSLRAPRAEHLGDAARRAAAARCRCSTCPSCSPARHGMRATSPGGRGASARSWLLMAAPTTRAPASTTLEQLLAAKEIVDHLRLGRRRQDHAWPPPSARWPPPTSAARCSCSPSTRPGGWPAPSASSSSATSRPRCPPEAFTAAGVEPRGELWAAMLDTKQSLGRPRAPPRARRRAPATPSWPTRSTRTSPAKFVQSHDYIAMERLYEIHASGRYDLIVVDTPPTRNALDFLDAPARMADFFSSRLLRWLTVPYRSRLRDDGVEALLHGGRPHPRLAVPGGHRRVLHPLPDDGATASSSGPRR